MKQHTYKLSMQWTGNLGEGTQTYRGYSRNHEISAAEKATTIHGSSDPAFRGDATRYNPEELLLAALSTCHMLAYLHLCAVNKINVVDYNDAPVGIMRENSDGSGEFVEATLHPQVTIAAGDESRAQHLHHDAHELCFIARSVNFKVGVEPTITVAHTAGA
jgi:organic hydroperoxide reductase OsmC/OhrA